MKPLERNDVERILRDVLTAHGLRTSIVQIDRTAAGWRVEVKDLTDRILYAEVPDGPPAAIRAVLTRWALDHD
jgi:hypothetical protein